MAGGKISPVPGQDLTFTYSAGAINAGLQLQLTWFDLSSGLTTSVQNNPLGSPWSSNACYPDGSNSQCQIRLDANGSFTLTIRFTGNTQGASFKYHVVAAGYSSSVITASFGGPTPSNMPTPSPSSSTPNAVWNEMTTFKIENLTGGQWSDSEVFWAIVGKDWATGKFIWVDKNGAFIPMSVSDNGALTKNNNLYSNYFHTIAESGSVTIPPINSARILFSVGSPMYIQPNVDVNGQIGYAGANIENPADPNQDVTFDFGEMAILPRSSGNPGIWVNTTRVDQFGFPLRLRVQGANGYDQTVGESLSESRASLFSQFIAAMPDAFKGLAQGAHSANRITAPAHQSFQAGKANANYLAPYIDEMWEKYKTKDLVFTLQNLGTFTGRVQANNTLRLTGGVQNGTYTINGKPTTSMVMLGDGLLNDAVGGTNVGTQLQIQAQVCAALNRHVFDNPANWHNSAYFYPSGGLANDYAKFWHQRSINGLAYGFAYDDVGDFSPSLYTSAPTTVTFSIGW
jgi:hypothetical protein